MVWLRRRAGVYACGPWRIVQATAGPPRWRVYRSTKRRGDAPTLEKAQLCAAALALADLSSELAAQAPEVPPEVSKAHRLGELHATLDEIVDAGGAADVAWMLSVILEDRGHLEASKLVHDAHRLLARG
jgi:hypothetical protein